MGQQNVAVAAFAAMVLLGCVLLGCERPLSPEAALRETLKNQRVGTIRLPAGDLVLSEPLRVAVGAADLEIRGSGNTRIVAGPNFKGAALLVVEKSKNILFADFIIEGNRAALARPPRDGSPENAFRVWYPSNGILADEVEGLRIEHVEFHNVVHFPVLISRSSGIRIDRAKVEDSGALNSKGRNNLSGGILIEEGSKDFEVRNSSFKNIRGNALWTHSLLTSPQLLDGAFVDNRFEVIGRDAIQVGHAKRVNVEGNTGREIGYPFEIVDVENGGTPVAIDTAGDVPGSQYVRNQFDEVNGKCIDLDGFHDGIVLENSCINRHAAVDYPHGHFGIVMNNTNPNAHSNNIEINGNLIDGAKYGGLFVMGSDNHISNNRFVNLNLAKCNESSPSCVYKADEPQMLQSGIYIGRGVARLETAKGNVIRGNTVTGHKMAARCVNLSPGILSGANSIESNSCQDYVALK